MRKRRTPFTIIWDFDGTLLPSDPYDSEHFLLLDSMYATRGRRGSFARRLVGRLIVFLDRRKWMGPTFKRYYAWVLEGTPLNRLDGVAKRLACKITETDRASIRRLHDEGHALMIISCGTLDLIERILEIAGIKAYFNPIEGNRLQCSSGRIRGIEKRLIFPSDKLKPVKALGVDRMRTVAVGDGYTDIPLLDWSAFPVLMDRSKTFKKKPKAGRYTPVASIPELSAVIGRLSIETENARGLGPEK